MAGIPAVMRFLRHQMRQNRQAELTVPQFRALVFSDLHQDESLSAMAEHLGLSLPATSRLVDLLVKRGLMGRKVGAVDRRRVSLSLTRRGKTILGVATRATQVAMAQRLEILSAHERGVVGEAMRILARTFKPEESKETRTST
jgi:DNA-binding MarR family transcriptional regulator